MLTYRVHCTVLGNPADPEYIDPERKRERERERERVREGGEKKGGVC